MRKTDEQLAAKKRERFETVAVRLAVHLGMSTAERFVELPEKARVYFEGQRYCEIALSLAVFEFQKGGLSIRGLSIKYAIPKSTLSDRIKKNKKP